MASALLGNHTFSFVIGILLIIAVLAFLLLQYHAQLSGVNPVTGCNRPSLEGTYTFWKLSSYLMYDDCLINNNKLKIFANKQLPRKLIFKN